MRTPTIVTGDDTMLPVTLKVDNATFPITLTAPVKARLVSEDHYEVYSESVTQSNASPGADWANSLVVVSLPSSSTSGIVYQGRAVLEIQVDDGYKRTWFVEIVIAKGNID